MLILSDSGILLRLFEASDPLHPVVKRAVDALGTPGEKLVTAPQNVAEFWNVCTRPASPRGGLGLSVADAEVRLRDVEQRFALLAEPPATYAVWRGMVVAHAVRGKQVHDARLAALMQTHGLTHILTLNGGDFARYPGVVVIDPATVLPPPPSPTAPPVATG
ncbi:MAG: PIN domain-containing protein [Gemmataceae bacterium]